MDFIVSILILGGIGACLWILFKGESHYTPPPPLTRNLPRAKAPISPPSRPIQDEPATADDKSLVLPPIPESLTLTGKAYVIDGDTIRIRKTKIRLAGIDAPETNMPWGQKSKWAMVEICKGQTLTVQLDGERSHDRLVGTCFLPDGRDIGAEIVKLGLALDLPHFSGGKYKHLEPEGARRKLANGRFGHSSIRPASKRRSSSET